MRKLSYAALAAALMLLLAGCSVERSGGAAPDESALAASQGSARTTSAQAVGGDVVELTEKMYVTYLNEIYANTQDYLGRTIRLQGMFTAIFYEPTDTTYYYVYRIGPGCCGNDGSMAGFEFTWDGEMPNENDWIEVTGVLGEYEIDGLSYLTLNASSVNIMKERGAENVYQ